MTSNDNSIHQLLLDASHEMVSPPYPEAAVRARATRNRRRRMGLAIAGVGGVAAAGIVTVGFALTGTGDQARLPISGPTGRTLATIQAESCLDTRVTLRQGDQSFELNPYALQAVEPIALDANEPVSIERSGSCAESVKLASLDASVLEISDSSSVVVIHPGSTELQRSGTVCALDASSSCRGGAVIVDPVKVVVNP
jgi:hypothetical protein